MNIDMNIDMKEEILKKAQMGAKEELLNLLIGTRFYPQAVKEAAKAGHSDLVYVLLSRQIPKLGQQRPLSIAEISLLNQALEGYALSLNFAGVTQMVSLGANIFHGLNALLGSSQLTIENATSLINCTENDKQKDLLENRIEALGCSPSEESTPSFPRIGGC